MLTILHPTFLIRYLNQSHGTIQSAAADSMLAGPGALFPSDCWLYIQELRDQRSNLKADSPARTTSSLAHN